MMYDGMIIGIFICAVLFMTEMIICAVSAVVFNRKSKD